jgi:hypothetical protein
MLRGADQDTRWMLWFETNCRSALPVILTAILVSLSGVMQYIQPFNPSHFNSNWTFGEL